MRVNEEKNCSITHQKMDKKESNGAIPVSSTRNTPQSKNDFSYILSPSHSVINRCNTKLNHQLVCYRWLQLAQSETSTQNCHCPSM